MAASRLVTGETELDENLGRQYAEALVNSGGGLAELNALLQACDEALRTDNPHATLKSAISASPVVATGAQRLAHVWYMGALPPMDGKVRPLSPEAYFGALLWKAVGAHPPGLSGGYFGHWRYLPDA